MAERLDREARMGAPRRRWGIAWLLGIGVLVNYFDRVNLSVSRDSLIAAFGINNVVFGYLSSAYNWTYAACQLPVGVILDRLGVRRVGRAGAFLWSVASLAAAATPNVAGLFGARFLLGVGEAPTFPANAKAIGLWFPPRERSLATSLFDSAAKFAPAVGIPLLGAVVVAAGWRWSFALTGAISLAYCFLFWRIYRDPNEDPALSEAERRCLEEHDEPEETSASSGEARSSSLLELLGTRKVVGLALGFGAYNYVFFLLLYWLPSYLSSALRVDLLHSSIYSSVPWLLAAAADLAIGGWLVDFLIRRGRNAGRVRRAVLIAGTALGLGILGAVGARTATRALVWIGVSIAGLSAAAPVAWSLPSLIAARNDVGKVGGIVNFSGQVSGIAASIATGYLVTARAYGWVFSAAAIYLAVGVAAYLFLLGKIERLAPR